MKKNLNVCLLNDSFPPLIDGVANTVVNYATIIQQQFGKAVVATPSYPNVTDSYDFDVLRYPSFDTTKLVGYRCGVPFNSETIETIAKNDIDIVHSHCPVASTFLGRMVRDRIEKPLVFTYHTKFDIDIKKAVKSKLIQQLAIDALVSNIEGCDEVWVVSKGAGENLRQLGYQKDYIVMPNGVDFEKGRSSNEEIETIRQRYGIKKEIITYLFVGRMMWYKGIRIILDALKIKKDHQQPFQMIFVGDGADFQEIYDYTTNLQLQDHCIFTKAIVDRQELKAIYSSCDVFLFPSSFDTNGIVVREAAASGLATILIKDSCASEDTIDQQNVIQIEENAESLAKVLIDAHNDKDYFHQIGKNAQDQLYCSWQTSVEHAYDRYLEVIEHYQFDKNSLLTQDKTEFFFNSFAELSKGLEEIKQQRLLFKQKSLEKTEELDHLFSDRIDETLDRLHRFQEISRTKRDEIKQFIEDELDRYL